MCVASTSGIEIVLKAGADGGSLQILRERQLDGSWRFLVKRNETAIYDLLSEEERRGVGQNFAQSESVPTFEEGLRLLDRYRWYRLYPLYAHPEYADEILKAVRERGGVMEEDRWRRRLAES